MEPLTFQDMQNLLQAIQKLYTLYDLSSFNLEALKIVDQLVSSDLLGFHATKVRTRQISHTFLPDFPGFTPEMERVIHQYFGEHPLMHHMPQTLNGAYQISDFVSRKELHCIEGFYQQFLRPLDAEEQMTFFLQNTSSSSWREVTQTDTTLVGFSLNRSQSNFTERDRLILNLLRPHLTQAYAIVNRFQHLELELTQVHQSLDRSGVIFLDGMGRVKLMTTQAVSWLQSYFPAYSSMRELPELLNSWVKYQFSQLNGASDLPDPCTPLCLQQRNRQLTIRLVVDQLGEQYLLLLAEEQVRSFSSNLEILGLSPRETEVLGWVIRGENNQAIAKHLSLHIGTVKKHLENIYLKLGVQSRTEAISKALEKLGILNSL